jgi:hypothetical protein
MPKPGGTIYAIGAVGTSWVKIGSTTGAVMQRLKILQTGQPFPLQVLATVPVAEGLRRIEKQVHAFLETERQRGEWFDVPIDTPALERLVVRAVQYIAAQEEQTRLARLHRSEGIRTVPQEQEALLGLRIMTLLHRQQKSVYALAKHAGVPLKTVQRICKGAGKQPSVWTIAAIARVLGVSIDTLVSPPDDTPSAARTAQEPAPKTRRQRSQKAGTGVEE